MLEFFHSIGCLTMVTPTPFIPHLQKNVDDSLYLHSSHFPRVCNQEGVNDKSVMHGGVMEWI